MVRALAGDSTMISGFDTEPAILSGLHRSQGIHLETPTCATCKRAVMYLANPHSGWGFVPTRKAFTTRQRITRNQER